MSYQSNIQLYQFKDFDMEKFIRLYLEEISEHQEIESINMFNGEATYRTIKAHSGVKKVQKIIDKCLYLQDTIIRRANAKKDDKSFSLSSRLLKQVVGEEYISMLNVLRKMEYIDLGNGRFGSDKHNYYERSKYSMLYILMDKPIEIWYGSNPTVRRYKEKSLQLVKDYQSSSVYPTVDDVYGETFRKHYVISLNYFKIKDKAHIKQYISDNGFDNKSSKYYVYFHDILNKLQDRKEIYSIDASGRMYHVLCNLSTDLKQYLNIRLALDCKNSHPLLFNYFIFHKHNIPANVAYNISKYLTNNISSSLIPGFPNTIYHNVAEYLRNELKNNNIENTDVAKLADDELEYIYLTSNGRLWDDINKKHPEFSRKEIKQKFFEEVLYSKTKVTYKKPFAKEFLSLFPSVYRLICDWKEPNKHKEIVDYLAEHNLQPKKEHAALSISMMNLEAQIFTQILRRMYSKRWDAVHIHDCIILPETRKKNQPTLEDVRKIMLDVFSDYGLSPTFD